VTAFARRAKMPTRYLFEKRPGLSRARNAGVRAARGDVVAFTDDDCLVDSQWVARIDAEFRADVELGIVGGRVELHDPGDAPVSVRVHRERVLVKSFPDIAAFMIGCNMSCRRCLLDEVGDFDTRLGAGTSTPSAEDWDFLYRSHKAGAKIVFSPDVLALCVKVFGADNVMYGSDYPHTIGDMPGCLARVNALPDATRDKVRGRNAQRVFGF